MFFFFPYIGEIRANRLGEQCRRETNDCYVYLGKGNVGN